MGGFAMAGSPWGLSWTREHARGHVMALAVCPQGLPWPWLLDRMVIFQNKSAFKKAN